MNKDGNVVFPPKAGIVNFQAASSKGGQGKVSSKIYNNNLKRSGAAKTILLKKKIGDIGITKYLPSFSKE
jgi:hypothetical protein